MSLHVPCPSCQSVLAIPEGAAGKAVRCPKCRAEFPAPAVEAAKPSETIATSLPSPQLSPQPREEDEPVLLEAVDSDEVAPIRRGQRPAKRSSVPLIVGGIVCGVLLLFCGGLGLFGYWIYRNASEEMAKTQPRNTTPVEDNRAFPVGGGGNANNLGPFNGGGGMPPGMMKPPEPPRLEFPPLPAPVPIKPAPIQGATTYKLPDTVDDLAVGGGGRFLILHFPKLRKLGVFDANEAKITHYVNAADNHVRFAAGMSKLLVYSPGSGVLQRWDLLTRQLEKSETIAGLSEPVEGFCMGSASAGPLLICAGNQQAFEARLLDIATFQTLQVPSGDPGLVPGFGSLPHRASANGKLITNGGAAIVLEGGRAHTFRPPGNNFYVFPGPDGKYVYVGGHGVLTNRFQPTTDAVYSPVRGDGMVEHSYVPAEHGPYYMHLHLKSGLLGPYGLPHNRDDPEHGVTIYLFGERQPVVQMANIGMVTYGTMNALQGIGMERSVHLIPRAHLLVVLPGSRDKLMLHPIDLEKKLDESGVKYLLVTSEPPTEVRRGQALTYAITVKSKAGGIVYKLESGPKGMTVTADGKLTWTVPVDFADKRVDVIVSVQDADKQERFHTFTLTVADAK